MSVLSEAAALKDIREAIERIQRYVGMLSLDDFLENTEKQDAVVRNFEIIGEATRLGRQSSERNTSTSSGPKWQAFETSSFTIMSGA